MNKNMSLLARRTVVFWAIMLVLPCKVLAVQSQDSQVALKPPASSSTLDPSNTPFFVNVGQDFVAVVKSPFAMSAKQAALLGTFVLTNVALIYGVDHEVDQEFALNEKSYLKPFDNLADLGNLYDQIGPGKVMTAMSASMIAGGLIFKDKHLLHTTRLMLEAALYSSLFTHLGKVAFNRARPFANRGAQDFSVLKFRKGNRFRAMPSGHATHIFAMMTVVVKQHKQWWVRMPALTLAASVALQRMDERKHWLSDVMSGAAVGYWVGSVLVNRYQNTQDGLSLQPYVSSNRLGISLQF